MEDILGHYTFDLHYDCQTFTPKANQCDSFLQINCMRRKTYWGKLTLIHAAFNDLV